MSCTGLCRCFSLRRANPITTFSAISRQQGLRCTYTNYAIHRRYHVETLSNLTDRHSVNNKNKSNHHPGISWQSSSSSSSRHGYSPPYVLSASSSSYHAVQTLGTENNNVFTSSWSASPRLCQLNSLAPSVVGVRLLHTSAVRRKELAESDTKLESTVKLLKEAKREKEEELLQVIQRKGDTVASAEKQPASPAPPRKSIVRWIKDEVLHYWHGFRLLGLDIKVAAKLLWRVLNGKVLTRREYRQFTRTVADMFRLVPFSVFLIIPFMEFLLPVAVKLFPNMLPSTFEDRSKKEEKLKKELKMKLEMAKFLQDSIEDMALVSKSSKESHRAHDFGTFIETIRTSGEQATNKDILKFSKLFENELTLDNLSRDQLIALCRLLRLKPFGTNNFLRFQLRLQLRNLMLDDKMIDKEGVETLTVAELQTACQARGMRAIGVPVERLESQLKQWMELHLHEQIPTSLLLLSRALYLPETLAVPEQLKATMASLPEKTATDAKIKLGEMSGEKVSNTDRLKAIAEEQAVIESERDERREEEREEAEMKKNKLLEEAEGKIAEEIVVAKETLVDTAPIIKQEPVIIQYDRKPDIPDDVTKDDIQVLREVIENIAKEKDEFLEQKEQMEELNKDIEDYQENLEDLSKEAEVLEEAAVLQESKSSARLSKRVNRLMGRVETIVDDLEKEKSTLEKAEESLGEDLRMSQEGLDEERDHQREMNMAERIDTVRNDIISVEELMESVGKLTKVSDEVKLRHIIEELDEDHDGKVDIGEVLKALKTISKEKINLDTKQIGELMDILYKEEHIDEIESELKKVNEGQMGNQTAPSSTGIPPSTAVDTEKKSEEMRK